MRKSQKREKELDRAYDFGDAKGFHNAAANVGFVKCRSARRFRHNNRRSLKAALEQLR